MSFIITKECHLSQQVKAKYVILYECHLLKNVVRECDANVSELIEEIHSPSKKLPPYKQAMLPAKSSETSQGKKSSYMIYIIITNTSCQLS